VEARDAAIALARARIAIGLAAIAAPNLATRVMFGRRRAAAAAVFARMLGGRDVALGLGAAIALDRGAPVRGWLEAGALADGLDSLSALLARGVIPPAVRVNTVLLSGAAAWAGIALARRLDPPPRPG
jgi:hypothetical protein